MTEPTEDDFWAEERARDTVERGRHADPAACGTCRGRVAAGGQVEHDECAQRALLLPAPDAPGYELITGMSEEEVWALPARFHVPVFLDTCTPKAWVCAVCWGDGWNTQWPCRTAQHHGTRVFTPEHQAETAAKKQAAELEHLRKDRDAFRDQRNAVFETNQRLHGQIEAAGQARLHAENQTRIVTHAAEALRARVTELEAELARAKRPSYSNRHVWTVWREDQPIHAHYATEDDARQGSIGCWEEDESRCPDYSWKPDGARLELVVGGEAAGVYISRADVHGTLAEPEKELAEARVELANYVGAEPTIAEEMAYLSRCLDSVLEVCDNAEKQANRWEQPLPVPEWVTSVRAAAEGLEPRRSYPPALPWARLMDLEDLAGFLRDLNIGMRAAARQAHFAGRPQAPAVLDALEHACSTWRPIAEAQHAHNTAPGPGSEAGDGRG